MTRLFCFIAVLAVLAGLPLAAQERVTLGWGRMFSNDAIGDGHDRWRSGSYQLSLLRGESFSGHLPKTPGALLEFRVNSQIIAPANLSKTAPGDRQYVGMLSFGAHTVFAWRGYDINLGSDLVIVGPQTGVGSFHKWIHRVLDLTGPKAVSRQIGDGLYPSLLAEVGRDVVMAPNVTLRPFVEAQIGAESLMRVGGDLVIGSLGQGAIMARDMVSGQRYRIVEADHNLGYSLVMGGDVARVADSVFLPVGGAAVMSSQRSRLRAGVHWQGQKSSVFYGVSYLSREFESQPEGQLIGGLSLSLKF
jgi:hypothetical protein